MRRSLTRSESSIKGIRAIAQRRVTFGDERQLVIARPKFGGEIFGEKVIPGTTQSMLKEEKSLIPDSTIADKCDSQVLAT
jgi:hypothetical protein